MDAVVSAETMQFVFRRERASFISLVALRYEIKFELQAMTD